ncbi:hypothetical protein THIOSC13_80015 [uncultured Thiomicrorhabdus sp.]
MTAFPNPKIDFAASLIQYAQAFEQLAPETIHSKLAPLLAEDIYLKTPLINCMARHEPCNCLSICSKPYCNRTFGFSIIRCPTKSPDAPFYTGNSALFSKVNRSASTA